MEILDEAMNTIKHKGFINYYGELILGILLEDLSYESIPRHATLWYSLHPNPRDRPRTTEIGMAESCGYVTFQETW